MSLSSVHGPIVDDILPRRRDVLHLVEVDGERSEYGCMTQSMQDHF